MRIRAVLVRTEYSSNIGASARAAANMGAEQLILIDPQTVINSKARQNAAGAQSMLENVITYASWEDFFAHEGDGVRIALTRRGGKKRKVVSLEECLNELKRDLSSIADTPGKTENSPSVIYLFFGPEADGLSLDDVNFMNHCCHLPIFGSFGSLNLAQAVLLALFIARQKFPPAQEVQQITGGEAPTVAPLYFPDELIRDWLTEMGFNIKARKSSAYITLKRLFLLHRPSQHEIQVINAILEQNLRKLKDLSRLLTKDLTD
jgi:tRNA/rRNA methyltransferase